LTVIPFQRSNPRAWVCMYVCVHYYGNGRSIGQFNKTILNRVSADYQTKSAEHVQKRKKVAKKIKPRASDKTDDAEFISYRLYGYTVFCFCFVGIYFFI
jgi:hypothetical protein